MKFFQGIIALLVLPLSIFENVSAEKDTLTVLALPTGSKINVTSPQILIEEDKESKKKDDLAKFLMVHTDVPPVVLFKATHAGILHSNLIGKGFDFSQVKKLVFKNLEAQGAAETSNKSRRGKKKLTYKLKSIDVPSPLFWSGGEDLDNNLFREVDFDHELVSNSLKFNESAAIDTLKSQPTKIWYGTLKKKGFVGSALFMVGLGGEIHGSIDDGINSYKIKSIYGSDGSLKMTYTHVNLMDLKDLNGYVQLYENDIFNDQSLSASKARGKSGDSGSKNEDEKQHNLQQDRCMDASGLAAKEWYDSDGPPFSCTWYASRSYYCERYGDGYSNFGFTANQACCACGGGALVVDALIVYTSEARIREGGTHGIRNTIANSVLQTNVALSNSRVSSRVRILDMIEYNGFDDEKKTKPNERRTNDDYIKDIRLSTFIKNHRNHIGADIVFLIGANVPSGKAYKGPATRDYAVGVVNSWLSDLSGQYTFAHEVGHLYNGCHDIEDVTSCPTNRGYIDNTSCFRTLMAYSDKVSADCPNRNRVLYFSNLSRKLNGRATGTSTRNNARAMNAYAPKLAIFGHTAAMTKDSLNVNERLYRKQYLRSQNGRYVFYMQGDGNIVIYDGSAVIWSPNIHNRGGHLLVMQGDGNLVVYTSGGYPVWASNTWGKGGSRLVMQNDRNLVMYTATGRPVWDTGTLN